MGMNNLNSKTDSLIVKKYRGFNKKTNDERSILLAENEK